MEGDGDVFPHSSRLDGDRLKTGSGDRYQRSPRLEEEREQIVLSQTRNQRPARFGWCWCYDGNITGGHLYKCVFHLNVTH